MLRAAWLAQELLSTFSEELGGVLLKPSEEGGTFTVFVEGTGVCVWDRRQEGGFPEAKVLKQRVRGECFPGKGLGRCLEGKK